MSPHEIVRLLMQQGKGILAADESTETITKRFTALGIPSNEETRRAYRELLFTTPGIEKYISGVIFYDETMRQSESHGLIFPQYVASKNILVGTKVDKGIEGGVTNGLEGLEERLIEYKSLGTVFTKWRMVSKVSGGDAPLTQNIENAVSYATIVQKNGMVPIVEPEILIEGPHTAEEAEQALSRTLAPLMEKLQNACDLPGLIIKTSMVTSGSENPLKADPKEVAERTVRALSSAIHSDIGGVVFLSGGQEPEEASKNFNAIARTEPLPWPIAFSFSRALQDPVLALWAGQESLREEAQAQFIERLSLNQLADAGGYSPEMEEKAL